MNGMRRLNKSIFFSLFFVSFISLPVTGYAADEDGYLSEISAEVEKIDVENESLDEESDSRQNPGDKADFEKLLEERYHGSFVFYNKLPTRTQLEIFEDYRRGAEIPKLREKIIDRYIP